MLYSKITLMGVLAALSSLAVAHPLADAELLRRVVSPDETCGNVAGGANHGYTCPTGNCCSQYVCYILINLLEYQFQITSFC